MHLYKNREEGFHKGEKFIKELRAAERRKHSHEKKWRNAPNQKIEENTPKPNYLSYLACLYGSSMSTNSSQNTKGQVLFTFKKW